MARSTFVLQWNDNLGPCWMNKDNLQLVFNEYWKRSGGPVPIMVVSEETTDDENRTRSMVSRIAAVEARLTDHDNGNIATIRALEGTAHGLKEWLRRLEQRQTETAEAMADAVRKVREAFAGSDYQTIARLTDRVRDLETSNPCSAEHAKQHSTLANEQIMQDAKIINLERKTDCLDNQAHQHPVPAPDFGWVIAKACPVCKRMHIFVAGVNAMAADGMAQSRNPRTAKLFSSCAEAHDFCYRHGIGVEYKVVELKDVIRNRYVKAI